MRRLALSLVVLASCGDRNFRGVEPLPSTADLKLVVAWDGERVQGSLLRAQDPTRLDIAEAIDTGKTVQVWIFPLYRAELETAIPGLVGATEAAVLEGFRPVIRAAGGSALAIPPSDVVLETHVGADTGAQLEFTTVPRAQWASRAMERPDLGIEVDDALACRALTVETFPLPRSVRGRALTAVDRDRAFLAASSTAANYALVEMKPPQFTITPIAGLGTARSSMSWDASSDTIWGLDATRKPYRIRPDGTKVDFPPIPNGGTAQLLAAGADGTVVALDSHTFPPPDGAQVPTYVLSGGRWNTVLDFTVLDIDLLRVSHLNRYIVYGNCWGNAWELDASLSPPIRHWAIARAGDGNCFSRPTDMALDDSQYIWLGENKDIKRATEDEVAWAPFAHKIPITSDNQWPNALAAMGEQRFAVAGVGGQVEVWIGDRWCVPKVEPVVDWEMGAGADGVAWFVSEGRVMRATIGGAER